VSRVAKIRVSLKTSDGLNTWTFRAGKDFKLKVFERRDRLYQAEGHFDGVGEHLSDAVLSVKEKTVDYAANNGISEDPRVLLELERLDQVARYFAEQVGS
jgi:hypothetical protein